MTLEEYKKLLGGMTAENFQNQAVELIKNLSEDFNEVESYKKQVSDLEKKNRELQDTNQNLFLKVTGNAIKEDEEEDPKDASIKKILENF